MITECGCEFIDYQYTASGKKLSLYNDPLTKTTFSADLDGGQTVSGQLAETRARWGMSDSQVDLSLRGYVRPRRFAWYQRAAIWLAAVIGLLWVVGWLKTAVMR